MSGPAMALEAADVHRALVRIAHEIVERNKGTDGLLVIGIHTREVPLAQRLAAKLGEIEGRQFPAGGAGRGHVPRRHRHAAAQATHDTDLPFDLAGRGGGAGRRRALHRADGAGRPGRPHRLRAAAGHPAGRAGRPRPRELPLRADYVGKNLPTAADQAVRVLLTETDGEDGVVVEDAPGKAVAS